MPVNSDAISRNKDRRCGLSSSVYHATCQLRRRGLSAGVTEQSFRTRARTISKPDPSTAALAHWRTYARGIASSLDDMEQEILREIVAGSSLKQIALKLDLQLAQVEMQKASLMRKLNATTTADLVRVGIYADFNEPLRLPSRFGVQAGR